MDIICWRQLDHSLKQFVDLVLAIAEVTTVDVVVVLLAPSAGWSVQFEGPQEVVDLLEDATNGVQLVDHVLDALDVVSMTQFTLDDEVVGDRDATSAMLKNIIWFKHSVHRRLKSTYLDESALVEQVTGGLEGWISVGDVRLGDAQHVECGLVELDERCVVDLTQAEELQHLLHFRCDLVDTKMKKIQDRNHQRT